MVLEINNKHSKYNGHHIAITDNGEVMDIMTFEELYDRDESYCEDEIATGSTYETSREQKITCADIFHIVHLLRPIDQTSFKSQYKIELTDEAAVYINKMYYGINVD